MLAPWKKGYDEPRQHFKKQRHYFTNKGLSSQRYGFSFSHVWMWELDYKESWAPKNWCLWTVVLKKTLESPLDCKEIQPVHPKGNQSWIFIGKTDAEVETPYFGHLMRRTDSLEKNLMLWNIEGGRRRGWQRMRWLDGITTSLGMSLSRLWEFDGEGNLACCSPLGHKESCTTEWVNWTEQNRYIFLKIAQTVKNLHAMQETWVWALGWDDPLEKGMATHSSILAWRIPWTEEPGGYSPWGCKEWDRTERLRLPLLLLQKYLPCNISIDPFHRGWESPHTACYVVSEMELKARLGALRFHSNTCRYSKPLHSIVFCS